MYSFEICSAFPSIGRPRGPGGVGYRPAFLIHRYTQNAKKHTTRIASIARGESRPTALGVAGQRTWEVVVIYRSQPFNWHLEWWSMQPSERIGNSTAVLTTVAHGMRDDFSIAQSWHRLRCHTGGLCELCFLRISEIGRE